MRRDQVVVYSISCLEGNASEVVRWLEANLNGRIVWLVDELPELTLARRVSGTHETKSELLRKTTWRGIWAFLRAGTVLFTDLVFGGPTPPKRRLFVNLWHGDGPKVDLTAHFSVKTPAQVTVAGTRHWGEQKTKAFRSPPGGLIVCGNPRIDQLDRPVTDSQLAAMGIDPGLDLVIWAPTYRHSRADSPHGSWKDSEFADPFIEVRDRMDEICAVLAQVGAQVFVKVHPLDAESLAFPGFGRIDNDSLLDAGVGLYQVLGRAVSLVTDYSSLWVDYIPANRPIGIYCPDLDEYAAGRGFDTPDFEAYQPGPVFTDVDGLLAFLRSAPDGFVGSIPRREAVEKLGIICKTGATNSLMKQIDFGLS